MRNVANAHVWHKLPNQAALYTSKFPYIKILNTMDFKYISSKDNDKDQFSHVMIEKQ